jgi:hypothetical protein
MGGVLGAAGSVGVAVLMGAAGCDDRAQTTPTPTSRPSVVAAAPRPLQAVVLATTNATTAAYPMRPPSYLTLDGREVAFPAAKMALIGHGTGGFTLRLCSDDPPTAIDPGYSGNSYVLDIRLAIDHLSELPAATWDFKHEDGREGGGDSASGIYLHGYEEQYHPDEVHVSFQKNGDELLSYISGTFLHSNPANPVAPAERVQVSGCLHTSVPTE